MSEAVSTNVLKSFLVKIGADRILTSQAQHYKIDKNDFAEANTDENNYLDLNEILDNHDLYEQFATLYVEETEKKADKKDAEKEKEEETKVKDKNGAGAA